MTDRFQVAAESSAVLDTSHLVKEMQFECDEMEMYPVLIGEFVGYFHDVDGGYHRDDMYHVINLIHEVQGPGSPPHHVDDDTYEAHLSDSYFWLEVEDIWEFGDYPDDDYILSLKVTNYNIGPYTFNEKLRQPVDKRETEYQYDE